MDNVVQINFISDDATGRNTATLYRFQNSNIKMDNSSPVSCRSSYYYYFCNADVTITCIEGRYKVFSHLK